MQVASVLEQGDKLEQLRKGCIRANVVDMFRLTVDQITSDEYSSNYRSKAELILRASALLKLLSVRTSYGASA